MVCKNFETRDARRGVTILEVLIVLTIIVMVAAVTGPRLIGYLGRAKTETALLQAHQITSALQLFYIDLGRYPSDAEGLRVLVHAPAGESDWRGPYLETAEALNDPWSREYLFEAREDGETPAVFSYGRDGREGGTGEDSDIRS